MRRLGVGAFNPLQFHNLHGLAQAALLSLHPPKLVGLLHHDLVEFVIKPFHVGQVRLDAFEALFKQGWFFRHGSLLGRFDPGIDTGDFRGLRGIGDLDDLAKRRVGVGAY